MGIVSLVLPWSTVSRDTLSPEWPTPWGVGHFVFTRHLHAEVEEGYSQRQCRHSSNGSYSDVERQGKGGENAGHPAMLADFISLRYFHPALPVVTAVYDYSGDTS